MWNCEEGTLNLVTLCVIFCCGYIAFAVKTGRVYVEDDEEPFHRADHPFIFWLTIILFAGMTVMLLYWRFECL